MRIDNLRKEYISEICALEQQCFSEAPWSEEGFLAELQKENNIFLCALEAERVIGCVAADFACEQCFISKVMVAPACRRQGVAAALLQALLLGAQKQQLLEVTLEVRASNAAAIALYEKFGFENIGIRRKFYRFPQEDAVIMTKKL